MAFEPVKETAGTLFVVSTPIGNLDDMTFRAVKCLKEVHLIACEDTRRTAKLLNHLGIRKPLISCFEHNELARIDELLDRLGRGEDIALVSDAGTPTISDPGFPLVRAAHERGVRVTPIPGPSALVAALSASGLPSDEFLFAGFLPRTASARRTRLLSLKDQRATLLFYEAPHRVVASLADMLAVLGDRDAFLCREVTKLHEELKRGRLSELMNDLGARAEVRGEIVLVVAGAKAAPPKSGTMEEALVRFDTEVSMGATARQAAKEAAHATGLPVRDIYARAAGRE
ncbi:MAG: 16S rRNA (cytidine(1402)-2'-O)-methyltransferase [Vicinamibacteria bacterium]|nr:16S rRNA (cytidine(1402)-2'-O)-methyltransferase [Vicinamibacteria bacterium]